MNAYVQHVLELLGERDPLEVLAATPSRLEDLFWELGEKGLSRTYAAGKWTAREVLAHLADVEILYGFRIRQVLSETDHRVQLMDQDAWQALHRGIDASLAVEVFRAMRTWNLGIYRSLTSEQLARVAHHPERGDESLGRMLHLLAGHDLNHVAQLERIAATPAP